MKKPLLIAAIAALTAGSAYALPPLTFTAKAGYNLNSLWSTKNVMLKNQHGFNVGAYVNCDASIFGLPEMWGLQSGLMFAAKGAQTRGYYDVQATTVSIYELQLPVFATFTYGITADLKLKANAGPTIACGLSANSATGGLKTDLYDTKVLKRFNFGVGAGVGAEWRSIYLGVAGDLGLLNLSAATVPSTAPVKTWSLMVMAGYTFDFFGTQGASGGAGAGE